MFDTPQIMRLAQGMARHAAARQGVIAENIAHADTPGYRARDLPAFAATLGQDRGLVATRRGHVQPAAQARPFTPMPDSTAPAVSPDGNTVSLEREMMRAARNRQAHDMALAVYGSARAIWRASLGR